MAILDYSKIMSELIRITESQGWRKATFGFLRQADGKLYQQANDDSQVDWRYLLPIGKESTVLDFGCGLGMASIVISRLSKTVISLDDCYENIKFLKLKLQQENIRNVYPVLIDDDLNLPVAEDCFDIIIIEKAELNFREEAIKTFFRLLRPKGVLFFRVENKLLKKTVNGRLLRLSYRKILMTLRKNGFYNINLFFPFPSEKNIQVIVPLEDLQLLNYYFVNVKGVKSFFQKAEYCLFQLFIRLKGLRYFLPHFYVVTTKA